MAFFFRHTLAPTLDYRLFLLQPQVVIAGLVQEQPFIYPMSSVLIGSITGTVANIRTGMTVAFGTSAGAWDRGVFYIRKFPENVGGGVQRLFIGLAGQGRRFGEIDVELATHVTVYDDFRVWQKPQVMVPNMQGGVTVYKDADLAVGQNTNTPPPVANGGAGWASEIDPDTGVARVTFTSGSLAMADSTSIQSVLWDIKDGTLVSGNLGDNTIQVDFPPGFRWMRLLVTDTNSQIHFCYIPVLADDPEDTLTIPNWRFERLRATRQGQEVSVRILDDIPADTYPDGTLCMIWQEPPPSTALRSHMRFIGWHDADSGESAALRNGVRRDTTLELADVGARLRSIRNASQEVENVASNPPTWLHMTNANFNKYIHYLLHWHSTALTLSDYRLFNVPDAYAFRVWGSAEDNLWTQVNKVTQALSPDHLLTCNPQGEMLIVRDAMLVDAGARSYTTVQFALTPEYIQSIRVERRPNPRVRKVYGAAILASSTQTAVMFSRAPGEAQGQGQQDVWHENQIALSQALLNSTEGHRYAQLNAVEAPYRITLARDTDANDEFIWLDPARISTFVSVTLPEDFAAQRGIAFSSAFGSVLEFDVRHVYDRHGVHREVELLWQRETFGTPGQAYSLEIPIGYTEEIWRRGGVHPGIVAAAYEPFNAADLAGSYTNLANPGTNDATVITAPGFDAGWVFNGVDQVVWTGLVPAGGWTMIVAFEDATGTGEHTVAGSIDGTGTAFYLTPRDSADGGSRRYGVGVSVISHQDGGQLATGIMGINNTAQVWRNAARDGDAMGSWSGTSSQSIIIGGRHNQGTPDQLFVGKVTHAYIYNAPLTPYQMYAVMLSIQRDLGAS